MSRHQGRIQQMAIRLGSAFYLVLALLLNACAPSLARPLPTASYVFIAAQNDPSPGVSASGPELTQFWDDCLVYEELVSGAVQVKRGDLLGVDVFCYRNMAGESVLIDQKEAIARIRAFMNSSDLVVTFESTDSSLNGPEPMRVAIFRDSHGSEFMMDVATWRVVEANLDPSIPYFAPSSEMPLSELRTKAEQILAENTPSLDGLRGRLSYEEGSKSDIYFFSWEDRTYQGWQVMPPMARIALRSDGMLVTYVNSLFLTK